MRKTKGFTIIEIIIVIALTTIFSLIFIQLLVPIREKLSRNISELEQYGQLLFVNQLLDSILREGEEVEVIVGNYGAINNSTSTLESDSLNLEEIFLKSKLGSNDVNCGVSNRDSIDINILYFGARPYLFCRFERTLEDSLQPGTVIHVPLISLLKFGTTTLSVTKVTSWGIEPNSNTVEDQEIGIEVDQYHLNIGEYKLQFGLFPHIFHNSTNSHIIGL